MRDAFGNELKKGDLVMLQLKQPWIYGRIAEVEEGGLVMSNQEVQPSKVVVVGSFPVIGMPHSPLPQLVALRDDNAPTQTVNEAKIGALPN